MLEASASGSGGSFFAASASAFSLPGGRACIQTILVGRAIPALSRQRRLDRAVRLPGPALIPSLGALASAWEEASSLELEDAAEIGSHYATTLRAWRGRFHARLGDVGRLGYDERFVRTWDFYLASCEALFRVGLLRDAQLVLRR
jgi:cyclopropane-fatty-acyl-phospholipid synthase